MLGFEAEMDPKIDAKRNKKSLKLEVEEKIAKMLQNECQMGSRKLPKLKKNQYEKRVKNMASLLGAQKGPLGLRSPKSVQNTP